MPSNDVCKSWIALMSGSSGIWLYIAFIDHGYPDYRLSAVKQRSKMSVTAANLTDGIRVDKATQKGSVYDVIRFVTRETMGMSSRRFRASRSITLSSSQNVINSGLMAKAEKLQLQMLQP